MRVLVVDDDPSFRSFLTIGLEEAGMRLVVAEDGERGLEILRDDSSGFDVILLDVQMPKASGWDLLLDLRESGDETPVIFVTNRHSLQERVRGLRMGADDYVIKPVEYEELIARIEAVVRRRRSLEPILFGDVKIDPAKRKVSRIGKSVELSPREYDLLVALVQANGNAVSRETLLREVWDVDFDPGTNVVEVHVGRLRRKIDRHGRAMIETVRGHGYRAVPHEPSAA